VQVAFTRSDGPLQAIRHHATAHLGYPQSTVDPIVFHACFDRQIRISKRWAKGVDGDTKTAASNGYVALHPVLSECLKDWRTQTPHSKVDDFVFPSLLRFGRVPISSPIFGADYLRPSANRGNMAEHIHEEFAALFVFRIALTSSTICSLKAAQN
jgi:hypothetical protein